MKWLLQQYVSQVQLVEHCKRRPNFDVLTITKPNAPTLKTKFTLQFEITST